MKTRCPRCDNETNILYEVYTGATVRLEVEFAEDAILSRDKYDLSDLDTMTPYYECPRCGEEVAANLDKLLEMLADHGR